MTPPSLPADDGPLPWASGWSCAVATYTETTDDSFYVTRRVTHLTARVRPDGPVTPLGPSHTSRHESGSTPRSRP